MEGIEQLLQSYSYWGNTYWEYAIATGIFVISALILKLFQAIILVRIKRLAEKTTNDFDDALVAMISQISAWFYIVFPAYLGSRYLMLSEDLEKWIGIIFMVAAVYEVIRAIEHMLSFGMKKYIAKTKQTDEYDPHSEAMIRVGMIIVRIVLWTVALLLILQNLGFNVSSLIASLGVGGLAVALALQNVLADMFSSFSIYIDKPFEVGDYIVVGEHSGTVKKIGLKTTRLQALRGEEIVISNQELTSARVQNLKKLKHRRVSFTFGVTYETSEKKIEKIPALVEKIISSVEEAEFKRCHFSAYSPSSLDFETVFTLETSDYNVFMDAQQEIYISLFKAFKKEKISFAYPTQTIHIEK